MCVIIWAPCGTIPDSQVTKAMSTHPDGWGFTVVTKRGLATYRSIIYNDFLAAWRRRTKGPVLFHARWATHGQICTEHCHPFGVNKKLVMAHNGIIPGFGSKDKSDTLDFVEEVIQPMPEWFLAEAGIMRLIAAAIGNSKLVFLTSKGEVTIVNEHLGVWKEKRWYSNRSVLTTE